MSSSESDSELVRYNSQPELLPQVVFLTAPEEKDFKVKIKVQGKKTEKFIYTLKKGQKLPYQPNLGGGMICSCQEATNLSLRYTLLQDTM